jgi:hypothetical protein
MRLADLPAETLRATSDADAPLRLIQLGSWVIVRPEAITMLRAIDKVVEVYTHAGYVGALTAMSLLRMVDRYRQFDWVLLSRAAAAKRSAILRIDHAPAGKKVVRAARVAGVAEPVVISRRHWMPVRAQLLGGRP